MPATDQLDLAGRVRALAEEAAAQRDLHIVDVQVRGQQGSRVIEIFADADREVGVDQLAALSRDVDFVLETEDLVKGRYLLNVSSPGADRPLVEPWQYRKHAGRALKVVFTAAGQQQTATGTLATVHDDALELETDGRRTSIRFDDVVEARVMLPW